MSSPYDVIAPPIRTIAEDETTLAGFDSVPLFMRNLPSDSNDLQENNTLAALQSLMFDDPPSEVAAGLKAQANDLFKARKFRESIEFYTRAIEECGTALPVEELRVLYSNRAAANLELQNYGSVLKDIAKVLSSPLPEIHPPPAYHQTTLKALLRSARALVALERLSEAIDSLDRIKLLETELADSKDVGKPLRTIIETRLRAKELQKLEKEERLRRSSELQKRTLEALIMRGITPSLPLFKSCPTDISPPHFDPSALPPSSRPSLPLSNTPTIWQAPPTSTALLFPVFFLNPLTSPPKRDLYTNFSTEMSFSSVLTAMEYDTKSVSLYLATKNLKVLRIGLKLELGKVLEAAGRSGEDGIELCEGWAIELVVVKKGKEGEDWVKNWKESLKEGKSIL